MAGHDHMTARRGPIAQQADGLAPRERVHTR
jgi:hypothetical protein